MKSLEDLDRWIGGTIRRWTAKVSGGAQPKELLEIRREILQDIGDKIEPKGKGEYLFPYNHVSIHIAAVDTPQRAVWEAAFADEGSLEKDVREMLREARCRVPADFFVKVEIAENAAASEPFRIEYVRSKVRAVSGTARPPAKLVVLKGQAEEQEHIITANTVNIGRLKEVIGENDGLRRRNDLAFAETETTVSREHAFIRFDAATGRFRLYDHLSQRGTNLFRSGRRIQVPRGSPRGVPLQSGDEIHLGEARIHFEITAD